MQGQSDRLRLSLWGTFRLRDGKGARLAVTSRKGMALLAMLATAPDGERTRAWLQDRLWGSRGKVQAQQSLRRELAVLKGVLGPEVLTSTPERVKLDLGRVEIDRSDSQGNAVFLEGIDIPGEEAFEDWLREQRQFFPEPTAANADQLAPALPRSVVDLRAPAPGFGGKPAIAVLPFVDVSGLEDGEMWAEGMSEDLIERLSRLRWLPVISAASLAELRGRRLDAAAVGDLVGAAYVLRGRLERRSDKLALQVNLLDSSNGQWLWSERFALPDGVTQQVMSDLAHQLVSNLESRIDTEQQGRMVERDVGDLSIDELVWRARWHLNRLTRKDSLIARELLERALEQRPNSVEVLIQMTLAIAWEVWSQRQGHDKIMEIKTMALRAITAGEHDGRGYMLAGMAELWLGHHDFAEAYQREALALNPSLAAAYGQLGSTYCLGGDPEKALEPFRTALRLSPLDYQVFTILGEIAVCHCMLGNFDEAVRYADLSLLRRPAYFYAHVSKINGLVRGGKLPAAKRALAALHRAKPGFQPEFVDWLPFRDRSWNEFLKEGVRLAECG